MNPTAAAAGHGAAIGRPCHSKASRARQARAVVPVARTGASLHRVGLLGMRSPELRLPVLGSKGEKSNRRTPVETMAYSWTSTDDGVSSDRVGVLHEAEVIEGVPLPYNVLNLKVIYPLESVSNAQTPVVIFWGAANIDPSNYRWLASNLACAGFVVVLTSSVSLIAGQPNLMPTFYDSSCFESEERFAEGAAAPGLRATLAALGRINAGGPLAGRLDLGSVALGGHGVGGRAALELACYGENFDQISACFTYGASLVNDPIGHDGPFYPPVGGVLPFRAGHPPLLMMGGTRDGVVGMYSKRTGEIDPLDTLRRSIQEGVVGEESTSMACLVALRGASHSMPTYPGEPNAAYHGMDMVPEGSVDNQRELFSHLVRNFLDAYVAPPDWPTRSRIQKVAGITYWPPAEIFHPLIDELSIR